MPLFKVFISSVQKEFANERIDLFQYFKVDPLLCSFFEPVIFEKLSASNYPPDQVYIDELTNCHIYLGLLGVDYGYEDANGVSPTEQEYNHAANIQLERWIFIKGNNELLRHEKEKAFIQKAGQEFSRKRFNTVEELKYEVSKACVTYLKSKSLIMFAPFDSALNQVANVADIDEEKIQSFIRLANNKRNFPLSENTPVPQVLAHLNMLRYNNILNTALLVFAKKPQHFFPSAIVKCAHFHGLEVMKPIPDHKVFKGDVFEQVDQAVDFVLSKINVSVGTRSESTQVPIRYEIPPAAIREAIVNAITHRDYTSNGSVQVMLFADRLEIINPGRLSSELTLEKLRIEHASYPNNPLLAECMYQVGYIERFGTGTLEIIRLSVEARLNDPDFRIDEGFKVILWRPLSDKTQIGESDRASTGQVPGKS